MKRFFQEKEGIILLRIGQGFDVHAFVEGRKLILGGVELIYDKGLIGHSDADVLTHAVMDAILGALALGDIGKIFPDNDAKYKNADSIELLKSLLTQLPKFTLHNLDITIMAEKPKIANFTLPMRENLAKALNCQIEQISIKGTTTEKLGFTGRGEGIAAMAVILLDK